MPHNSEEAPFEHTPETYYQFALNANEGFWGKNEVSLTRSRLEQLYQQYAETSFLQRKAFDAMKSAFDLSLIPRYQSAPIPHPYLRFDDIDNRVLMSGMPRINANGVIIWPFYSYDRIKNPGSAFITKLIHPDFRKSIGYPEYPLGKRINEISFDELPPVLQPFAFLNRHSLAEAAGRPLTAIFESNGWKVTDARQGSSSFPSKDSGDAASRIIDLFSTIQSPPQTL